MFNFKTTKSSTTTTNNNNKKKRRETSPTPANNASQMAPTSFFPSFSTSAGFDLTLRSHQHHPHQHHSNHHNTRDPSSSRHRRQKAVTNPRARIWNSISMVPDVRETALTLANSLLNNFDYAQASYLKEILDFHIALSLPDTPPQTDMITMIDSHSLERILTIILDVNIASIGQVQGSLSRELQLELVVSCLLLFQLMGVTNFQPTTFRNWMDKLDALSKALTSDREKQSDAQSFDGWFFDQFAHELFRTMPSSEGHTSRAAKVVLNTLYAAGYVYQFNGREFKHAVDEVFAQFRLSPDDSTEALAKVAKLTLGCIALLYQSEVQDNAEYEKAANALALQIAGGVADQIQKTAKSSQIGKTAIANISSSTLGKTVATKEYYKYGLLFFLNRLAQAFPGNVQVVARAKQSSMDTILEGAPALKLRLKALEVSVRTRSDDDSAGNEERLQRLINDVSHSNKLKDKGEGLKKDYEKLRQFLEQRETQVVHALGYVERQLGSQLRLLSGPSTAPAIMDRPNRTDFSPPNRVHTLIEESARPIQQRSSTTGTVPYSDKFILDPLTEIPITVTQDPEAFDHDPEEAHTGPPAPRVDTVSTDHSEPLMRQSTWSSSGIGSPSFGMSQAPTRHDRRESRASNSTSGSSNARRQTRDWNAWNEAPEWEHLDVHDFTFMSDEIKPIKSGKIIKRPVPWKMPVISDNCDFICYASASTIRIGSINGLGPNRSITYHDWEVPSSKTEFIKDVSVANDGTLVVITEQTTYIHSFPPNDSPIVLPSKTFEASSSIWGQSCVMISPESDKIVIGLQQAALRLKQGESGRYRGKLRILQRSSNGSFRSPIKQDVAIPEYETRDRKKGLDIPKILSFSRDGAYLACSTQEASRIYVWRLGTSPYVPPELRPSTPTGPSLTVSLVGHGKMEFQQNDHTIGITSLTILSRRASNPYLLVTVHRSQGLEEDAALTLVPITTVFSVRKPIRHTQPLHYACLASTATLSGSTVAVLNKSGTISILATAPTDPAGLHLREVGTLTASSGRILTGKEAEASINDNSKLGKSGGCLSQGLDGHEQAKLHFTPDGTRLVAADKNGKVLVWRFHYPDPETLRQNVSQASPSPIPSGRFSMQSEAVHELAESSPYLSASPQMLGTAFSSLASSSLPRSAGGESYRSATSDQYVWGGGMPHDANGFGGRASGVSQSEGGGVARYSVGSPVSPLGPVGPGFGSSTSVPGERVGRIRAGTHH
ncbi:hypothetical protein BJ508DRAFT_417572 [Ascobolus immersus RN42]|uniref:WD40 repeat-like protein n=1 Tax=Ascobolus immersus RN42 TaxID=1160509 RepID=A0A3N4HX63_ASCIM|nr:hypothetical protein BJ508DRAFT_417572 [Ascobolus immersus RN42]